MTSSPALLAALAVAGAAGAEAESPDFRSRISW
jgi:hypothetical protein